MTKIFLAATLAAALISPAIAAQAPTAASLAAAEDLRFQDQIAGRVAALTDEVTDDLIYTHANGMEQSKAQFLHDAGGVTRPKSMKATDRTVRVFGDVGYTHEHFTIELGSGFKPTAISSGVYLFRHGHWMLDAWQTTETRPAASGGK